MKIDATRMSAHERALVAEMIDLLQRKLEQQYEAGATLRDAHPKTLGVLRGEFTVAPDLPAHLRVGVFQPGRVYDCWVRVSNASNEVRSDAEPDLRGFAIKLACAEAEGNDEHPGEQDFVLMDHPTMPLGTVPMFRDAIYYMTKGSPLGLMAKFLVTGHVGALKALHDARRCPTSPFDVRYWSTTPYQFGLDEVVKYGLLPTSAYRSQLPDQLSEDYLSVAMERHLAVEDATFDFCVQLQREGMPIEDAAVLWDEDVSPFVRVASLRLSAQSFRTAERALLGEALTFSPAHALPVHAPLGGLNRARAAIYKHLSEFRHARNQQVPLVAL